MEPLRHDAFAPGIPSIGLVKIAEVDMPTDHADFRCVAYADGEDGTEQLALVLGDVDDGGEVMVRLHSECFTGDVLGSRRCDCGPQLDAAMARVARAGRGVIVYLRGHEGRGIGLAAKLRAYALQEQGHDTVDANHELGYPADLREYAGAARILRDLGVQRVRLLTNNPAKVDALLEYGFEVEREAHWTDPTDENADYLQTKRDRMGHVDDA